MICPFDELLQYANKGSCAFDIGCGQGQFALLLAEFAQPRRIGGIEISSILVEKAECLLRNYRSDIELDIRKYDGIHIPEFIHQYDIVYMIDVLHHIARERQVGFISDIYKKIAAGTRLVIKDIDAKSPLVYANRLHDFVLTGKVGHEMRFEELLDVARSIGFTVLDSSKRRMFWYPHFTIVLSK